VARHLTFPAPGDGQAAAKAAGLRYSTDTAPGIRRVRKGRAFAYLRPDGRRVTDAAEIARIRQLVIPPAWTSVWISLDARGHLQATGRDARGRKQYRYHPRWRVVRDETKFGRLSVFGRALPAIRRRTDADLRRAGLPREKVLAAVVRLLERTLIRVGNSEYARTNKSFGLTTLRDGHVNISGSKVHFVFRGKSGIDHQLELDDRRLARIVKQCRDLPGQQLFQYRDQDGALIDVTSDDVNAYLKEISGEEFTSKDFRTWAGTVLAVRFLQTADGDRKAPTKKAIVRAVEQVAKQLGNTKAVCRKCYIHPAVIDTYLDGGMSKSGTRVSARVTRAVGRMTQAETAVLALLQRRAARKAG
jgi:DNA topoisomerase-1